MKRQTGKRWIAGATAIACALLTLSLTFNSCTKKPQGPSVVLILIDALRADHLGAYGNKRDVSPFIDSLASEGVICLDQQSQATQTPPSMSSLMTGMYPDAVGFSGGIGEALSEKATTLAERMKAAGYDTAAIYANAWLSGPFGFMQGFDYQKLVFPEDLMQQQQKVMFRAEELNQEAFKWMHSRKSKKPFFLYMHYLDVHHPYLPPKPYDTMFDPGFDRTLPDFTLVYRYIYGPKKAPLPPDLEKVFQERYTSDQLNEHMKALYDAELRYLDDQLRSLVSVIRDHYPDTVIIISSDHGEEFLEHGNFQHATSLHIELTHVPLIVNLPGKVPAARISRLTRNIDICPTILDVAGIELPENMQGRPLSILWSNPAAKWPELAFSRVITSGKRAVEQKGIWKGPDQNVDAPPTADGKLPLINFVSVTTPEWRLIKNLTTGQDLLYNRAADPTEQNDLAAADPQTVEKLNRDVGRYFDECARLAKAAGISTAEKAVMDDATRQKLKSLGYLDD